MLEQYIDKIELADAYEFIKKIDDKSVDCIYVDVPYLYDSGGGGSSPLAKRISKIYHNDLFDIREGFDYEIMNDFIRVSKKLNCYIWCSKMQVPTILDFFVSKGYLYEMLCWCKTNPTPNCNGNWLSDIEYCLYFRESGIVLNDGYEHKSKWYVSGINKKDKDLFKHPTIKPLELIKRHLAHTTQPNDIVFDPFMGSGSTAVACKELNRHFIGCEINPKWHKIANDRINNIDANGQQSFLLR